MVLESFQRMSKRSQRDSVGYDLMTASFNSPDGKMIVQVWDIDIKIGRAFEYCSDAQAAIIIYEPDGSATPENTSGYVKSLDGLTTADLPKFILLTGKKPLPEQEKSELLVDLHGEKNVKLITSRLDKKDEVEKILRVAALTAMRSPKQEKNPEKTGEQGTALKVVVLGDERRLFWNQSK